MANHTASPLAGAGIFWINSRVNDEAVLPYDQFVRWYDNVHIPDVVAAPPDQPLPVARRYEALPPLTADESRRHPFSPFLAIYKMPDLGFVGSDAFRRIPVHFESLPEGGPIARFASFHARSARYLESWARTATSRAGDALPPGLLVSEAIQPSGDVDAFCRWYRDDYIPEVATLPGWVRSTRFEVVLENEIRGGAPLGPRPSQAEQSHSWLTLHEFDAVVGGIEADLAYRAQTGLLASSESARHVAETAVSVETVPFRFVRAYGDASAEFGNGEATLL